MRSYPELPFPVLDALQLGAHRLSALSDDGLFAAVGVRIAFTGREGGVSVGPFSSLNCMDDVGDSPSAVARNRALICEAAGVDPSALFMPHQVHGTRILEASSSEASGDDGDGVVGGADGTPVMLVSADCLLFIVVSPSGRFVLAHAGWRGTVAHIARKAVLALADEDDADVSTYNVYIGPHIHAECFEVGEDIATRFREEFGAASVADARHVRLSAAVCADVSAAGIDERRICDAGICTVCNAQRFFSYRASGGTCGRHAAFAVNTRSNGEAKRVPCNA